jgi:hypothetical protein
MGGGSTCDKPKTIPHYVGGGGISGHADDSR